MVILKEERMFIRLVAAANHVPWTLGLGKKTLIAMRRKVVCGKNNESAEQT